LPRAYRLITDEGDVETHGDCHLTQGLPFYTSPRCLNWTLDSAPTMVRGFSHPEPAILFSQLVSGFSPPWTHDPFFRRVRGFPFHPRYHFPPGQRFPTPNHVTSGSGDVTSGHFRSHDFRLSPPSLWPAVFYFLSDHPSNPNNQSQTRTGGVYANYRGKILFFFFTIGYFELPLFQTFFVSPDGSK